MTPSPIPRAAIYARYSSEHQREASLEDQIRICRRLIAEKGWILAGIYSDAAMSGASALRPDYQRLQDDARRSRIDVIVSEASTASAAIRNISPPSTSRCRFSASRWSPWPRARFRNCTSG